MPSVQALEEKQKIVSEIKEKVEQAKSLVLFDYRGMTDKDIKVLRNTLRDNDSEYKVYKNTLMKLAFKDLGIDFEQYLAGPTAIAFSNDDVAAVKVLADTAKKNDALILKAGYVESEVCDKDKLNEFAKIPSREALYTMVAAGMIGIVKDLSIALNLYCEQKEAPAASEVKEEPETEAVEETQSEETADKVEAEEQAEEETPASETETSEEEVKEESEAVEEQAEEEPALEKEGE